MAYGKLDNLSTLNIEKYLVSTLILTELFIISQIKKSLYEVNTYVINALKVTL